MIKVAAIQVQATNSRESNIEESEKLIEKALADGAMLVVMPEIFSAPFVTGETDMDYWQWSEPLLGPTNEMIGALSKKYRATIVSSIFEQGDVPGIAYNTAVTFSDGDLISVYRKSHLPFSNAFPEKFYFRPGNEAPHVDRFGELAVGTIICYERHFPELGRVVALAGANVMAVPVACASAPTKEVFQIELRAQAIFNEFFVVCANRVGTESGKCYYGTSAIYGPDGSIRAQGSDSTPEVVMAEIDLGEVESRRHVLPFFRDRRPELYRSIWQS